MFKNCISLKVLDLSDFHFMKVENMRGMFYGCSSLAQLKLSDFKNKNIQEINTYGMFSGCQFALKLKMKSLLHNFEEESFKDFISEEEEESDEDEEEEGEIGR